MKNITNLDIKRQRAGLTKDLSAFAVVRVYKKASMKTKLELIAIIEALKHKEKNYYEALDLIFKLEKVKDISGIISKLSKQKLDAKVLSDVERLAMAPKTNISPESTDNLPKSEQSYFQKNKLSVLVISSFTALFLIVLIVNSSSKATQDDTIAIEKVSKKQTYISLYPEFGHKFVYTNINGVPTTFMLDTGASTSTVSEFYLNKHIRSGFVSRRINFIRNAYYTMASGNIVRAEVWQFPSITIGPKTIYNVEIAVMQGIGSDEFLMGMSTINKLGRTTIDLSNNKIIIN